MRSQERAAEQLRSLEEFSTSSMEERRLFEERLAALEAGANDLNMALGTLDTLDDARGVERMAPRRDGRQARAEGEAPDGGGEAPAGSGQRRARRR